MPDGFLSKESCLLGPLTILDRCLNVPISSSSVNNFLQCISADGQIGFVYNTDVEPVHVISISKPKHSSSTMSNFFQRKPDMKKSLGKAKGKLISKDMIGLPQADFIHAFHIGVSGETFGDVTCLAGVEKADVIQLPIEKSSSVTTNLESNYQKPVEEDIVLINEQTDDPQTSSLLDEVLQAFTEIYSEPTPSSPTQSNDSCSKIPPPKPERSTPTSPKSPTLNVQISLQSSSSIQMTDFNQQQSPQSKTKSNDDTCRFTRELEQRLQNGDISEEAKNAYNLLIDGQKTDCSEQIETHTKESPTKTNFFGSSSSSSSTSISTSSTSNPTQSNSSSSSSNKQKSNRNSHYSSTSTDNDISLDLKIQNDLSPLKLLRNGIHLTKSPVSSTSNTLSNLSSSSPLFNHSLSSNIDDNRSISSSNSRSLSTTKHDQQSLTGQPLPPPPDLSSLGSKLTTATHTQTLKIPVPLTSNTSRLKKRFNLFT